MKTIQLTRPVQRTRDKLVRDLTLEECGRLLVHAHDITDERRKALLYRSVSDPEIYFSDAAERAKIEAWIEAEDYFPAGTPGDWHPKSPNDCRLTLSARGPSRPRAPKPSPWQMAMRQRLGLTPERNDPISRLLWAALESAEDEADFLNAVEQHRDELAKALAVIKAGAK